MEIWKSPFLKTEAFSTKSLRNIAFALPITAVIVLSIFLVISGVSAIESKASPTANISHQSGVYSKPIYLTISYGNISGDIRYTTDGSDPTIEAIKYEKGILISRNSVIKVALFRNRELKGVISKKTYLFTLNKLPVVSIITSPDNLWDPLTGIYVKGQSENISENNYDKRGEEWKKPAYLEYFDSNGRQKLGMDIELMISGGSTRRYSQKSLRICAKADYGEKFIRYDFFDDGNEAHKCILLRNAGNDWNRAMLRDSFTHKISSETNLETQKSEPSIVYLNGEYWGIHNIREFYDEYYLKFKYGTNIESIAILEAGIKDSGDINVRKGNLGDDHSFIELIRNLNDYDYLEKHMSMESFTDYFLSNVYFANEDWLNNNIRVWRLVSEKYSPYDKAPLDGKWRWMLFDLDLSMGSSVKSGESMDTLAYFTSEARNKTILTSQLIRGLLNHEKYKNYFINRYADLLNSTFEKTHVLNVFNETVAQYEPEMPEHIVKWGTKSNIDNLQTWKSNIEEIKKFINNRTEYTQQHFIEKFNLSGVSNVYLSNEYDKYGYVEINTINTKEDIKIKALVYFNDIPIKIEAVPYFGYSFVGWSDVHLGNNNKITVTLNKDIEIKPVFKPTWWRKILGDII